MSGPGKNSGQVWFSLEVRFNSLELDSEVGQLVGLICACGSCSNRATIKQQVTFACNGGDERAIVGLSIGVVRQGREEGREEGPHEAPGAGRQQRCQHQDQEQGHGHDH